MYRDFKFYISTRPCFGDCTAEITNIETASTKKLNNFSFY